MTGEGLLWCPEWFKQFDCRGHNRVLRLPQQIGRGLLARPVLLDGARPLHDLTDGRHRQILQGQR